MPSQIALKKKCGRRSHTHTHTQESDVKMETKMRVMWPQAKECLESPEAGKPKE